MQQPKFLKNNPCKKCGSVDFFRRQVYKYVEREYCALCGKLKDAFTEREDKENIPSHCGKCIFFSPTVFEGETANGHGSWEGYCLQNKSTRHITKSRYYGCDFGVKKR